MKKKPVIIKPSNNREDVELFANDESLFSLPSIVYNWMSRNEIVCELSL